MRRWACVAILTGFIGIVSGMLNQAQAYFYDGNELMKYYEEYEKPTGTKGDKSPIRAFDEGRYIGYVYGVFDSNESKLCLPSGVTQSKAVFSIVGNYLKAHPETWGEPAYVIVLNSLKEAYPCPKKKRQ